MNLLKKIIFLGIFLSSSFFSTSLKAQTNVKHDKKIEATDISFSLEDIQKMKALIEHQLNRSVSDQEFNAFGTASKENLSLFKTINDRLKNNPFFSQNHIDFIISSMEDRLGLSKPKPKDDTINTGPKLKA